MRCCLNGCEIVTGYELPLPAPFIRRPRNPGRQSQRRKPTKANRCTLQASTNQGPFPVLRLLSAHTLHRAAHSHHQAVPRSRESGSEPLSRPQKRSEFLVNASSEFALAQLICLLNWPSVCWSNRVGCNAMATPSEHVPGPPQLSLARVLAK